ncbi:MAG TPA: methyl-accepting chemotaxis protein, partial [Steroidobacteraceae bacterium]
AILGHPFFTAYDPIKDSDGRVVGILYVGIARSEFFAPLDKLRMECAILTFGVTALLAAFCLMVARRMFRPLNVLRGAADCLSRGELGTDVPFGSRSDDIGRLAKALLALRSSALEKQRIEAAAGEQARALELEHHTEEERRAAHLGEQRTVVESLAKALEQLSEGNLRYRIEAPFAAGYDKLRTDFNAAVAKLAGTLGAIATAADAIRSATAGINASAGTLAGHTQEQAARLQETSSTLGRIAAHVDETASAVDATRKSVDAARDIAEQSGSVVSNATAAMSNIEGSSRQIQQIIGVIDEIAFQTNLLALNAAVEAARAGEQGRGFAVVAGEVRNLASRSSEAAQQVKNLIMQSTQQVTAGTGLVRDTGAALERIVTQVKQISSMVRDVTEASIAHAKEIRAVDSALRDLDTLTAQNVTMVDDSARASHTAAQQAQDLMRRIVQFQIGAANSGAGAEQHVTRDDAAAA